MESISSINIIEGCNNLAIVNNARTSFSLSPTYLETSEDALIEKNVPLHSVVTAFAKIKRFNLNFNIENFLHVT